MKNAGSPSIPAGMVTRPCPRSCTDGPAPNSAITPTAPHGGKAGWATSHDVALVDHDPHADRLGTIAGLEQFRDPSDSFSALTHDWSRNDRIPQGTPSEMIRFLTGALPRCLDEPDADVFRVETGCKSGRSLKPGDHLRRPEASGLLHELLGPEHRDSRDVRGRHAGATQGDEPSPDPGRPNVNPGGRDPGSVIGEGGDCVRTA